MRRLLILGATGGTGRALVEQALAAGHDVTAFVRDPNKLAGGRARIVVGDIMQESTALDDATRGQDVVMSALGRGQSFQPAGLIAHAVAKIISAMDRAGVRRLIFESAFGIGPTWQDAPFIPRLFIRTLLRRIYADKAVGDGAIQQSALDWTIVQPVGLTNGPRTGHTRVAEHLPLRGFPTVSRADVAAVMLGFIDDRATVRKTLLVAS